MYFQLVFQNFDDILTEDFENQKFIYMFDQQYNLMHQT
jgi:hypothetical protein